MAATRVIEPEWLDELPPADPRAERSRRDLVRVNALMGNARIVSGELRRLEGIRSIAEIGAGDGLFLARALRGVRPAADRRLALVDRHPVVSPATLARFAAMGWQPQATTADVFDWLADPATPAFDVVVANLFLHHFEAARLAQLLELVSRRAAVFIACEPRRSAFAAAGARLLGVVGCSEVTRHDAVTSVRAGFTGRELAALWPAGGRWRCVESARGLFSHGFVAYRA